MYINYIYDEDDRLTNVVFEGLYGTEVVTNLKEAVDVLTVTNPAKTFVKRMNAGYYSKKSQAISERDATTANTLAKLFKLSKDEEDSIAEMNVMLLLASAFTTVVNQAEKINSLKTALEDAQS